MRAVLAGLLMTITTSCDVIDPPPPPSPKPKPSPVPLRQIVPEIPLAAAEADALSREFGLPGCRDVTRLREVRADGLHGESWRVRSGKSCFGDWVARSRRYAILAHLDVSQTRRDAMPWLCGIGRTEHDSMCSTQGREPTLVIEQPFGADFILLRRITKETT